MRRIASLLAAFALGLAVLLAAPSAGAIVGGQPQLTNPGVVSIWTMAPDYPHRNRCTGTLIRPQWVLTAAHCWEVIGPGQPEVRVGVDNTTGYQAFQVAAGYVHPDFDPNLFRHDLLLLKLATSVPASVQKPMAYGTAPTAVGELSHIAGWGWPCDTVNPAIGCTQTTFGPVKRLGTVTKADSACPSEWFPGEETCFAAADGSHSMACFGDSGAPLYTKGLEAFIVRSVVLYDGDDWGSASCSSAPDGSQGLGVAVDVYPHVGWMYDVMTGVQSPGAIQVLAVATSHGWLG